MPITHEDENCRTKQNDVHTCGVPLEGKIILKTGGHAIKDHNQGPKINVKTKCHSYILIIKKVVISVASWKDPISKGEEKEFYQEFFIVSSNPDFLNNTSSV